MGSLGKNILFWSLVIIAAGLIAYGGLGLLAPKYRDPKKKKKPMQSKKPKQLPVLDRIGGFDLEPGRGISYDESGQRFPEYASGQNPNLTGYYDQDIHEEPDPKGEEDFFSMFME